MCPPERRARIAETLQLRPWQRHSLVLAVAGFFYISFGLIYLQADRTPARNAALEFSLTIAPMRVWSAMFILVGVLALASTRWPPQSKTWGYTAMSTVSAYWGAQYLAGVLFLDVPLQSLSGALLWLLVTFLWWAIAGLMNPDDLPPRRHHHTDHRTDHEETPAAPAAPGPDER